MNSVIESQLNYFGLHFTHDEVEGSFCIGIRPVAGRFNTDDLSPKSLSSMNGTVWLERRGCAGNGPVFPPILPGTKEVELSDNLRTCLTINQRDITPETYELVKSSLLNVLPEGFKINSVTIHPLNG